MFMLYKIEAGLSFAQVRVSRTVEVLASIWLRKRVFFFIQTEGR